MPIQLDEILAADEECRSRISFAEKLKVREIDAARASHDQAVASQAAAAEAALEQEIRGITAAAERLVIEQRNVHDEYLRRLDEAGERKLEDAARLYTQIIAGEQALP